MGELGADPGWHATPTPRDDTPTGHEPRTGTVTAALAVAVKAELDGAFAAMLDALGHVFDADDAAFDAAVERGKACLDEAARVLHG